MWSYGLLLVLVGLLFALAFPFLVQHAELDALLGVQYLPDSKQHPGSTLAQRRAGGLDAIQLLHDEGLLGSAVYHLRQLVLLAVQRVLVLPQLWNARLEHLFNPGNLVGGEGELSLKPLFLPPLEALSSGWVGNGPQQEHERGSISTGRREGDFHS